MNVVEASKDIDGQQPTYRNIIYKWNVLCHLSEFTMLGGLKIVICDVSATLCMISLKKHSVVGGQKVRERGVKVI